jgi:acetoin utilization protein AcuB
MLVEMWMTRAPITIVPTTSISETALIMARRHIRRVVVVESPDGRVVGMVTASDVARAFPPDLNPASAAVTERSVPAPVATIMTRALHTIGAGTGIDEAARRMRREKIGALPVMRGSRLVGLITESDVFRALVEMSDPGTAGVRVTFELAEDEELVSTVAGLCADSALRIGSLFSFHHRDAADGPTRRLGVARLIGDAPAELVDGLWRSHHRVLAVVPCPSGPE